ncbi:MAG TPA: hypothetical protein VNN07_05270 [Candidatus Tectomicrobia bacterium]|nr:hypothetical protein [Candidatus Tectomicrobia bacterium]
MTVVDPARPTLPGRTLAPGRRVWDGGVAPTRRARPRPSVAAADAVEVRAVGVGVRVSCPDPATRRLVRAHYECLLGDAVPARIEYAIRTDGRRWQLRRAGRPAASALDAGELLLQLDQDLLVQLQRVRADLFFVHAAALAIDDRAIMLVAPSGGGKSTMAWALAHHGMHYLSDELAPLELAPLSVQPYPRALTLKDAPPNPYPLPLDTIATSRGFHVPPSRFADVARAPTPLAAIVFLHRGAGVARPAVCRLTAAQAGARLYANALNALAHPNEGIDAALNVVRRTPCFALVTAELDATCAVLAVMFRAAPR